MTIQDTLNERQAAYGTFADNAKLSQELKCIMANSPNWGTLRADQAEALEMIAFKISRILTGDPNYRDNWHDIGGYAKLVDDRLLRDEGVTCNVRDARIREGRCPDCGVREAELHMPNCPHSNREKEAKKRDTALYLESCMYCDAKYPGPHQPDCPVLINAREEALVSDVTLTENRDGKIVGVTCTGCGAAEGEVHQPHCPVPQPEPQ